MWEESISSEDLNNDFDFFEGGNENSQDHDEAEDDHGGDEFQNSQSKSVSSGIDEVEVDSHKDGETEDDSDIDDERSSLE